MVLLILLALVILSLAFVGAGIVPSAITLALFSIASLLVDAGSPWSLALCFILTLAFVGLAMTPMRVYWISRPVFTWFRRIAPKLSDTEREALEAGTVWWDGELFSGNPNWSKLLGTPKPILRDDEKAFLDGPVEQLCAMLDGWEVQQKKDLPADVWEFLRKEGFFSLIIEKKYGGLEFSPFGNSEVVTKIASHNLTAAVTVMVPNSLGPGELLRDFGTQAQRDHYLPRLANGTDIPCFALTGPMAGSDAAAMPDKGIVCRGQCQGEEVIGLRVTWDKRYITLAPVATVLGLAFRTYDPDHLLGERDDLGISCALIPADTPGVWTGNRHFPVGAAFMNGPTRGENVFIPLDYVIGGRERIGQGWSMLMHSLAAGRAISLPALGTAGTKFSARYSGEYARIRRQFGLPIAYFEGVEEPLARLAGEAYRLDAARRLTLSALQLGEKPGVISAMLKFHATEANRRCVNDAMDIHGGKGIITGPGNYLASLYQALPIAITVEGANILTRSLIIFGQGAIRNHPFLQTETRLAEGDYTPQTVKAFDRTLFAHIGFVIRNAARSFVYGITGARLISAPVDGRTAHYYRQLTRLSAVFAFVADVVLLSLGGTFKFKEKISGRLADAITHLYLACAILKHFEDCGQPEADRSLVHWGVRESLYQTQVALLGTLRNLPTPGLGLFVRWLIFPLGRPYKTPSDKLGKYVARILITRNAARDRLFAGLYQPREPAVIAQLSHAFEEIVAMQPIEKSLKKHFGVEIRPDNVEALCTQAVSDGILDEGTASRLKEAYQRVGNVIAVDDFAPGSAGGAGAD